MEKLLWFFSTTSAFSLLSPLLRPLLIGLALFYSNYFVMALRLLWRKSFGYIDEPIWTGEDRPDALIALPTLLRKQSELEGLQSAILSIIANGYPGRLVICPSIDHANFAPDITRTLIAWSESLELPDNVTLLVAEQADRGGKAMAIENAIRHVDEAVERGLVASVPEVFFNMDADSELAPESLERMVCSITRPGRFSGERPMIVASNVSVRREHYWQGWRNYFTVSGQISIQVAREYMTAISLARHNVRLIPVTGVSGALYCTWTELHRQAPRYASFVRRLGWRDLVGWWLGKAAPSFERSPIRALPEATTGPGDDTWIAWLAMSARWDNGRISLELPATPLHALGRLLRSYIFRPIAYDWKARVFTASPTSVKGLFRQRVRWNSSRIWLIQRFGLSFYYQWQVGFPVLLDVLILVGFHVAIVLGFVLLPLGQPSNWLGMFILGNGFYMVFRGIGTYLAMLQDDDVRGQWHKLLALPLSGIYHIVFNIATTVVGFTEDLFLFGVNTGFTPEETLIRAGTGRVAVAYRLRRGFLLAVHSVRHGGIPFGAFWFGWKESHWTPNGYAGWTDSTQRVSPVVIPPRDDS